MRPKLIEDLIIPNMESTEKKHHQEDGLYYHLTTVQRIRLSKWEGYSMMDSELHWTSLKREREEK
jgi:hypothetical protein